LAFISRAFSFAVSYSSFGTQPRMSCWNKS
jgi:hypothetical protein